MLHDGELQLVVEFVVVVGLHVVEHTDGVCLHSTYGAIFVVHAQVRSQGNLHLFTTHLLKGVGFIITFFGLGGYATHLFHHLIKAAFFVLMLLYLGSGINDELIFWCRGVKIPDRFEEVGFIAHPDETIEQLFGDGHGHYGFTLEAVEQSFESDVFSLW